MEKEYNIVEGNYKSEDEVVVKLTESKVVESHSVFHVGRVKEKIKVLTTEIDKLTDERAALQAKLDECKEIVTDAVKEEEELVITEEEKNPIQA